MISETARYLRRIAAHDPTVAESTTVVNIDQTYDSDDAGIMVLDLSDGTSITLDWSRFIR